MTSFQPINNQSQHVFQLASEIWNENYKGIISQNQIDYMLDMMYNSKRIQQDLDEGYLWEFITYNNNMVGYLAYVKKDDNRVFLSKIYLKTSAQGLGIGKQALQHVKTYAQNCNANAVYLTVNKNNIKGIRAYKKFGFNIIAEEVTDIGNGYVMDDFIFQYKLV
ncbi:MAG: GNAT family N-acetyltransferase [Flavobacteriaceae bacterium]